MKINLKKLKFEMARLGLTQSEMARRLGVQRQSTHAYTKGRVQSFRTIEKIAKLLGCDPRDLIV